MTHKSERTKLCIYCEGRVPFEAAECPYCGSELAFEPSSHAEISHPHEPDHAAFHYEPPYKGATPSQSLPTRELDEAPPLPSEERYLILPVLLFSIGVLFTALALLMVVLSTSQVITFEFNSRLWPFYLILGLPLAFFGFRKLQA